MNAIQLSLFPTRGFGLLGLHGELVEDWTTGEPLLVHTKRAAERQTKHVAFGCPRVVRLERHYDYEHDELTFVIGEVSS